MNKQFKTIKALSHGVALAVALVSAGLASSGSPAQAQTDPIQSVKALNDAINSADFDRALAAFADDAVVVNPLGVFVGRAEIARWLEPAVKTDRVAPKTFEIKGPFVISTGAVALDRFTKVGVPYVEYRAEYIVGPDGKIRFFAPVPMPTPEQAAKLGAPPQAKPKVDPIKVAQAYVRAVNNGNANAAAAMFAPDSAALVYGGAALFSGKAQIEAFHKVEVKTTRAKPETWEAHGNTVINTGLGLFERLRKLGMEWVPYRTEYVIENGKIRFFRGTLLLTPEQQAKVAARSASQ